MEKVNLCIFWRIGKSVLNFLGKSSKNIDIVNRMLTEFKKHGISVDDLKSANNLTSNLLSIGQVLIIPIA